MLEKNWTLYNSQISNYWLQKNVLKIGNPEQNVTKIFVVGKVWAKKQYQKVRPNWLLNIS